MLPLAEQLAHSTVRIECDLAAGGVSTGTGFFYALNQNEAGHVPVIVTNRHVVEGSISGRFLLTLRNADGGPAVGADREFQLDAFEQRWVPRPDSNVDLCVMPIAPLLLEAQRVNATFFYAHFDKSLIPSADEIEDMVGLESITMVG